MQTKYGVLIAFMLMGTLASADGFGSGPGRGRGEMGSRMRTELGLSKEQENKLETHRIDQRAEMEKLMLVVRQKREALKTELEKTQLDKSAVRKLNEQMKDAQNELADQRLEGILYVREVLTPEQFKKFQSLRPDPKQRRGENGNKRWEKGQRDGSRRGEGRTGRGFDRNNDGPMGAPETPDEDPMDMPKNQ